MFALPLIFLCNTLVFVFCLEERFKIYVTASIGLVAYIVSLVFSSAVSEFFSFMIDESVSACIFNLGVLFFASIFFSSNNVAHKLLLLLTMQFNFTICAFTVPQIFAETPIVTTGGSSPVFAANIIYLLLSLLMVSMLKGPFHHFFRRSINKYSILACLTMYFACLALEGLITEIIGINAFEVKFFTGLIPYLIILIAFRAVYATAKAKEKDFKRHNTEICASFIYSNVQSMMNEVATYKSLKKAMDYNLEKITEIAGRADDFAVVRFVKGSDCMSTMNPFVKLYNEDPIVNAIVANKTVYASNNGVKFTSDIELNRNDSRVKDIYVLLNQMIDVALKSAVEVKENSFINISNQQSQGVTAYEVNFSCPIKEKSNFDFSKMFEPEKIKKLMNGTIEMLIANFLGDKRRQEDPGFDFLADIVSKIGANMQIDAEDDYVSIKVMVKN
ncbi:MAG: hypothetical protein R3Y33_03810 [Clostridia bacterium]